MGGGVDVAVCGGRGAGLYARGWRLHGDSLGVGTRGSGITHKAVFPKEAALFYFTGLQKIFDNLCAVSVIPDIQGKISLIVLIQLCK